MGAKPRRTPSLEEASLSATTACHSQLKGIFGFDSDEVNPLILKHCLDFSFVFSGRLHAPIVLFYHDPMLGAVGIPMLGSFERCYGLVFKIHCCIHTI